jgi:Fe-Mn family superoxide dismutase
LPYGYDALEPYIDAETMQLYHDKHYAAYINNLNNAVAPYPALAKLSVEELVSHLDQVPEAIRIAVRNNGGGHANHSLFWQLMRKNGPGQPKGEVAGAIDRRFASFSSFQDQFTKAPLSVFGSGWA